MYCKNCGNELRPGAVFCEQCGYAVGKGNSCCAQCGAELKPGAKFCGNCGAAQTAEDASVQTRVTDTKGLGSEVQSALKNKEGKDRLMMAVLAVFFGAFGVHNFIMGYKGKAIAQLLITLLSFLTLLPVTQLWGLIEGILILCRKITVDAKGVPLIY